MKNEQKEVKKRFSFPPEIIETVQVQSSDSLLSGELSIRVSFPLTIRAKIEIFPHCVFSISTLAQQNTQKPFKFSSIQLISLVKLSAPYLMNVSVATLKILMLLISLLNASTRLGLVLLLRLDRGFPRELRIALVVVLELGLDVEWIRLLRELLGTLAKCGKSGSFRWCSVVERKVRCRWILLGGLPGWSCGLLVRCNGVRLNWSFRRLRILGIQRFNDSRFHQWFHRYCHPDWVHNRR